MNPNSRNILVEVLLELTLVIGSELEFQKILTKTIPLWLRRLNCTSGAVLEKKNDKLDIHFIIPTYLHKKGLPQEVVTFFESKPITFCEEYKSDREYHYLFPLGVNRYFYFARIPRLSKEHCNELFPVTQFFAKSLDNALERERRILAEKRLDQERRLLRTMIDHIPDPIYLKDINLRKILSNKADHEFIGLTRMEDLLGKTDEDVYPEEVAAKFRKADLQVLESGLPIINQEGMAKNAKGDPIWVLVSKFPFRDADGKIIGLVGVSRDITSLKATQENIKRLSLVASQTTNGVVITDIHGRVEWINDGFTRLSGYTLDDMVGNLPGDILQGPDSDREVIEKMATSLKAEKAFEAEIINYKKDGTPYWVHIHCNPLRDEQGHLKGFMAIESDITEKVIFNEELIQAKDIAEKAEKAEKTFLANMSHEIRTPLNAIIGMTSLLKDTDPSYEQVEYIETLDYSSKFLLRLINDILDLAKIESGKTEPNLSAFNLHECLKKIYQLFQVSAQKKGVDIYLIIDPKVPVYIEGDEVLLQQALNNLIGNALKFTKKGSIWIRVSNACFDDLMSTIEFEIEDTGIGIDKEDITQIFKKFTQVGRDDSNLNRGTGLGLSITKEIIELMGGKIEARSILGVGTAMNAQIPFKVVETMEVSQANQESFTILRAGGANDIPRRALVVEDNFMNQKYISRLLQKAEIDFDLACNGQDAVDLCYKSQYSFILMDIQMPVFDGFEATKLIRSGKSMNKTTPIIALTASAMIDQRVKAMKMGMNDYLSKPFTPQQLHSKLDKFSLKMRN